MGVLAAAFAIAVVTVSPSLAEAQVVATASGAVEFLGLEDWTPEKIQRSLGYASSEALHACVADLKKAGFPDANVTPYRVGDAKYTVVTVIEPKFARQLAFNPAPMGEGRAPVGWTALVELARDPPSFLQGAFLDYAAAVLGKQEGESGPSEWKAVLRSRNNEADYQSAIKLIGHKDHETRVAAAMVLVHFGDREPAWWALMDALRDPNETVRVTAMQSLISLATHTPQRVDWSRSRESIAAILRGTNLMALSHVLAILPKTGLSPSLGRDVLGPHERRLVLALLEARHDRERDLAHGFLVSATGQDFGLDAKRWKGWFSSM
jgi:hypothetical protein